MASEIEIVGNDLSATATTLAFDFSDTNAGRFIFGGPSFVPYVAFETSAYNLGAIPSREIVNLGGSSNEEIFNPDQVIAQTPEPGTLVTTLGGLLMILGLAAWKRRRQAGRPSLS